MISSTIGSPKEEIISPTSDVDDNLPHTFSGNIQMAVIVQCKMHKTPNTLAWAQSAWTSLAWYFIWIGLAYFKISRPNVEVTCLGAALYYLDLILIPLDHIQPYTLYLYDTFIDIWFISFFAFSLCSIVDCIK